MSLADVIVAYGPYAQDYLIGPGFAGPLRWLRAAELNALREELIAGRQAVGDLENLRQDQIEQREDA